MTERKTNVEEDQWSPFPIEGTSLTLLWKTGKSGFMPDMNSINVAFFMTDTPPSLTIGFLGGSYLDVNPNLHTFVDATGNRFVDGGGDCALIEANNPIPLVKLSDIITQERANREKEQRVMLALTLLRARERQMWEIPEEDMGMYPPNAIRALYGRCDR